MVNLFYPRVNSKNIIGYIIITDYIIHTVQIAYRFALTKHQVLHKCCAQEAWLIGAPIGPSGACAGSPLNPTGSAFCTVSRGFFLWLLPIGLFLWLSILISEHNKMGCKELVLHLSTERREYCLAREAKACRTPGICMSTSLECGERAAFPTRVVTTSTLQSRMRQTRRKCTKMPACIHQCFKYSILERFFNCILFFRCTKIYEKII